MSAGGPLDVRGTIEYVLKDKALREAVTSLHGVQKEMGAIGAEARKLESQTEKTGISIRQMAAHVVAFFAASAIVRFAKDALEGFLQTRRGIAAIGSELRQLNQSASIGAVKSLVDELGRTGRVTSGETIPALSQLIGITRSAAAAMELVRIAGTASSSGMGEFSTIIDSLTSLLRGRTEPAALALGVAFQDISGKALTASQIYSQWKEKVEAVSGSMSEQDNSLRELRGRWDGLKDAVGEAIAPIADRLPGAMRVVEAGIRSMMATLKNSGDFLRAFGKLVISELNFADIFTEGIDAHRSKTSAAFQELANVWNVTMSQIVADIAPIWEKSADDRIAATKQGEEAVQALLRAAEADGVRLARERAEKEAKAQAEAIEKHRVDLEQAEQNETDALESIWRQYYENLQEQARNFARVRAAEAAQIAKLESIILQETIAATKDGTEAMVDLQLTQLDRWYYEQFHKAGGNHDAIAALDKAYAAKRKNIEKAASDARIKIAEDETSQKIAAAGALLSASSQFIAAAFGESKSAAIAQALISGAQAILGIWEHWAWNPYVAGVLTAIAAATTAVQLATIRSAKPAARGRGFDDPTSDRLVYEGSRKWAKDVAELLQAGWSSGLRDFVLQGGPDPVFREVVQHVDSSRTTNVSIHTAVADEHGLRNFMRMARRVERRDTARLIK